MACQSVRAEVCCDVDHLQWGDGDARAPLSRFWVLPLGSRDSTSGGPGTSTAGWHGSQPDRHGGTVGPNARGIAIDAISGWLATAIDVGSTLRPGSTADALGIAA